MAFLTVSMARPRKSALLILCAFAGLPAAALVILWGGGRGCVYAGRVETPVGRTAEESRSGAGVRRLRAVVGECTMGWGDSLRLSQSVKRTRTRSCLLVLGRRRLKRVPRFRAVARSTVIITCLLPLGARPKLVARHAAFYLAIGSLNFLAAVTQHHENNVRSAEEAARAF